MTTTATTTGSPRLVPLSIARLAGNGLFRFVYPFLGVVAVDVGLGEASAGLLITGLAVGGMLVPLVRRLVSGGREAPRRLAVVGLLALLGGALVLGGLAPLLAGTTPLLGAVVALLGMVVLGAAKPLLDVGAIGYVSDRVPFSRRARATSVMELTWAGGLLVLAPAGLLAAATSWQLTLVLLGVASAATALLLWRWMDPDDAVPPDSAQERATAVGATSVETDPGQERVRPAPGSTWRFLLVAALLFAALESTFGVVGLWLERVQQVDPALLGALTAFGALGELTGSAFVLGFGDRIGKPRALVIGLLACALGFGLLPLMPNLVLAMAMLAVGLFGTETAIVAAIPLASEVVPGDRTGFLARMMAVSSISRAVLGATGPALLVAFGIGANGAISAVAALAAAALVLQLVRREPRLAA